MKKLCLIFLKFWKHNSNHKIISLPKPIRYVRQLVLNPHKNFQKIEQKATFSNQVYELSSKTRR